MALKLLNFEQQLPQIHIQPAAMPRFEIHRERGGLEVDQTSGRRTLGMYPPIELGGRIADLAYEAVLEGIARRAQEGDRYAAIHSGEDVIVELAYESMFRPIGVELNPPPYEPPHMRYTPDHLTFAWQPGVVSYRMAQDGKVTKLWLSDYNRDGSFNWEG